MLNAHVLFTLGSLLLSASPGSSMGSVVRVEGEVVALYHRGTEERIATLAPGDEIDTGTIVRTGRDGRAQLLLDDRSLVNLGPSTEIDLSAVRPPRGHRRVTVKLVVGSLWARVSRLFGGEDEFDVEGPSAVAGVRGTSFFVEVPEGGAETRVAVLRGRVALEDSGGRLLFVSTMERGVARLGGATTVERVSAEGLWRLQRRLATPSWSDRDRMQRTWRTVLGGMEASWRSAGVGSGREAVRRAVLGDVSGGDMPAPLLNQEPPPPDVVVHGRVELQPAPN